MEATSIIETDTYFKYPKRIYFFLTWAKQSVGWCYHNFRRKVCSDVLIQLKKKKYNSGRTEIKVGNEHTEENGQITTL